MNQDSSELALQKWSQQREPEALGELLRAQRNRAYAIALRMVRTSEEAEDVVQNACIKLMSRTSGFENMAMFELSVYRAVVQCAMDSIRKQQRRAKREKLGEAYELGVKQVPSSLDHIAENSEHHETRVALRSAVSELPEDERAAVVLCYGQGMSVSQTAQVLELSRDTVRTRLIRALSRLRQRLQKDGHENSASLLVMCLWQDGAVEAPLSLCHTLDNVLPGRVCAVILAKAAQFGYLSPAVVNVAFYQRLVFKVFAAVMLLCVGLSAVGMKYFSYAATHSSMSIALHENKSPLPIQANSCKQNPASFPTSAMASMNEVEGVGVPSYLQLQTGNESESKAQGQTVPFKTKTNSEVKPVDVASRNLTGSTKTETEDCPVLIAVQTVGIDKESFQKIKHLRDVCGASMTKINHSVEMKKLMAEAKKVRHTKEALVAISTKIAEMHKPAMQTFHKGTKEIFGNDDKYFKFVDTLPEFYKTGAFVRAEVEKKNQDDF